MAKMTPAERASVQAAKKENSPANQAKIAANRASALAGSPDPNAGMGPDSPTSSFVPDVNKPGEGSWINDNAVPASVSVSGGGGGSGDTEPVDPDAYSKYLAGRDEDRRIQNATATMQSLLSQYNLTSLYNTVVDYVKRGYDAEAISVLIRTTPEYKSRFPAMEALSQRGRAISEASYIDYEQTAAALEKRYGLPAGMLMGNVTGLLTNDVSASELNDRVMLAASASLQAPTDLKNTFKDYYGIDSGGLTAYFLDPTVAAPLLEKQYASTVIGTEAVRQGLAVDVYSAENLQSLGITREQAQQGFETIAGAKGLTQGRGDVTTQQELISGTLTGNVKAKKNIERAAGSRVGRFQQGGQYVQNERGSAGLGTAATR